MINSLLCVALAIYFEAQSEPALGQIAVAQVIYNRLEDSRYPDTACDVVKQGHYQNDKPIRNQCQFSFYCDGKSDEPTDKLAWYNAIYFAGLSTFIKDNTEGATHYHSIQVFPEWAYAGKRTAKINGHIFYTGVN
jgi:spore germination cell wall hydrolase CwlJ-like protein